MGVTIHYQGRINDINLIDEATNELSDVSNELGWKCKIIDDEELILKGAYINPPVNCEALTFLFDKRSGILKNRSIFSGLDLDDEHHNYNSTKTQYAPVEVHITIIKLLKYLKKKYISDLNVFDEGEYWETEDANRLKEKIEFLNEMMDVLEGELKKIPAEKNDTAESIADKIEKIFMKIQKRNRNRNN